MMPVHQRLDRKVVAGGWGLGTPYALEAALGAVHHWYSLQEIDVRGSSFLLIE